MPPPTRRPSCLHCLLSPAHASQAGINLLHDSPPQKNSEASSSMYCSSFCRGIVICSPPVRSFRDSCCTCGSASRVEAHQLQCSASQCCRWLAFCSNSKRHSDTPQGAWDDMSTHLGAVRGPVAAQGVALEAVLVPREHLHAAVLRRVRPHVPRPHCVVLHGITSASA